MKKILLASTVLVAAGAVSAQAAEPLKLGILGYMTQQVGYADQKSHMNKAEVDQQGYAEINFAGETTLDNGLTVAVRVDTYATQNGDTRNAAIASGNGAGNSNVRRAYMTLSSGYGQVVLGQREDYGATVHNSAPDQGWGLQDGDFSNWIAAPSTHNVIFVTSNNRYSVRADKITLITPTWHGLQAGFTYTPDINTKNTGGTAIAPSGDVAYNVKPGSVINGASFGGDMYQAGLSYRDTLGDVSVKSDFAYSIYNIGNMQTYQAGLQLGYAGFTLGGSFFYRDVDSGNVVLSDGSTYNAKAALRGGLSYDVAVAYNNGPFGVSFGYFRDQSKSDAGFNGRDNATTTDAFALSAKYTLGAGVDWRNSLYYVKYDGDDSTSTTRNKGIAFVTGMKVSF